jgi:chromate transporter
MVITMAVLLLIYEFFKTGLFAVGGGLAAIPFLKDIAEKYDWYSLEQLAGIIAVSESAPGPIGVNMAVYAGYHAYGIAGGIIAALALTAPSIIVITIVSRFIEKFRSNRIVNNVFFLLRPVGAGLIAGAVFPILIFSLFDKEVGFNLSAAIMFVIFTAVIFIINRFKIHPIVFIAAGAVAGIIFM